MLKAMLVWSWYGRILAEHDTEPSELLSGALKVTLGLHLLWPGQTFAGNTLLYGDMAILPEWAWGMLFVAVGVGHLGALRNGNASWRRWAAFAAFLVWSSLGFTFLHTQATALVGPTFAVLAVSSGWVYVRLGILARGGAR